MSDEKKALTVVSKKQTRVRISDEMRLCVELMATEGLPVHMAAERANISRDTAVRNMRKPHVLRLFNQQVKEIRDNAAQAAYLRINEMALNAKSEQVRLKANEWVAGVDGISKVQKVQGHHSHSHAFRGFSYPDLDAIVVDDSEG